jgi:hypothetical protein
MSNVGMVLQTALGLILLWTLFYFGVRPYRIDAIRHRLFVLRDKLFQFALNGGIAFDSPAYVLLRRRINTLLRYGHSITLSRMLIIGWMGVPFKEYSAQQEQRWEESIDKLNATSRATMEMFSDTVILAVFRHLLLGNPLTVVICIADYIVNGKKKEIEPRMAREKVALLEEQAALAQSSDIERELQPA